MSVIDKEGRYWKSGTRWKDFRLGTSTHGLKKLKKQTDGNDDDDVNDDVDDDNNDDDVYDDDNN